MADREQIRRDAEKVLALPTSTTINGAATDRLARDCLALLAELERAEQERDQARQALDEESAPFQNAYNAACERADAAEVKLAKVPALVEALTRLAFKSTDQRLVEQANQALAAWNSDQ